MSSENSDYTAMIDKATRLAYEYESKYLGCSQTTMAGLIEAFGIGGPNLLRASTCLAGGIARRGQVCGVLTAGLMVIGFLTGRDDLAMFDQYQRAMEYANVLYVKFEEEFGSASCLDIQELKFNRRFNLQSSEEREELHRLMAETRRGCQDVASVGARLAGEIIAQILESGPPFARIVR